MTIVRIAATLFATILLAGCTDDTLATARLERGRLVFAVPDRAACIDYATVTDARRSVVWTLGDSADGARPCVALPAHELAYGAQLVGIPIGRSAQELVAGEGYALLASPGSVVAVFRYNGTAAAATNLTPGTADWCAVRYPGSQPDRFGQCRIK